jgi:hypothetical protein
VTLARILIFVALLFSIAITWRYRNSDFVQGIVHPKTVKPLAIEFDNGTVRQYKEPDDRARAKAAPRPVGSLRKCVKGAEVVYTNSFCPPGLKELELSNGTLTVVSGGAAAPAPAKVAGPGHAPAQAEPTLAQRRIEQVVGK